MQGIWARLFLVAASVVIPVVGAHALDSDDTPSASAQTVAYIKTDPSLKADTLAKPEPAAKSAELKIEAAEKPFTPKKTIVEKPFAFRKAAKAYLVRVQNRDIWSASDEERLPPASLTKLMTAILVLENYRPDDVVTISKEAAAEPKSKIGLHAGDHMHVEDLLAATLIHSANDACHALADWRDGDEAKFVVRMNKRAHELGLKNTHFVNACGLDAPDHYSTARDIAALANIAMDNPTFARLARKQTMVVRTVDGRRRFAFNTTNALVGHYPGMMGGKTGFTNGAGPCLVAMAERNGVRVMLVLLNSHNRWWNASGMLDLAFAHANRG